MKAAQLKEVDREHRIHQQAYANFKVKAMQKNGKNKMKPVYTKFKKFYDYEAEIEKVNGKKEDSFSGVKAFLKQKGGAVNA
ncbi:hypothetical protein [Eubacterium callanderi]|uniref:hypothetical protein n=1 Tax=Eubacterium callanderi TaxID=53442 RepID=UPI0039967832